jgi:ribosomal protein S18 acetylase RimI-like enzyme
MAEPAIRAATVDDEMPVTALWRACGLVVPYNDPVADFRFARGRPNSDVLVAADAARIAGSVMVGHDGHRGWLYYVAVDPEYRRRGIGRLLVRAGEEWLARLGVAKVQLMVRESNAQIARFYERIGYVLAPRIILQKWLNPAETDHEPA